MHPPSRVKVTTTQPGQNRVLFYVTLAGALLCATIIMVVGFLLDLWWPLYLLAIITPLSMPLMLWWSLRRANRNRDIALMHARGFVLRKPCELPEEVRSICQRGELGFHNHPSRAVFVGEPRNTTVVVSEHIRWTSLNQGPRLSSRWIVRTGLDLPHTTIRPKSMFVDYQRELGDKRFDDACSLSTRDIGAMRPLLLPLVNWFVPEEPIQREHWLLDGPWIMLEVYGHTDAKGMLRMAELVLALGEALETQARLAGASHNTKN